MQLRFNFLTQLSVKPGEVCRKCMKKSKHHSTLCSQGTKCSSNFYTKIFYLKFTIEFLSFLIQTLYIFCEQFALVSKGGFYSILIKGQFLKLIFTCTYSRMTDWKLCDAIMNILLVMYLIGCLLSCFLWCSKIKI